ncbi:MAG: hypothetical protein JW892_05150 [Anaerolineae bacterium]|nr:hypothetical protein [Anaerolineae bacterium]
MRIYRRWFWLGIVLLFVGGALLALGAVLDESQAPDAVAVSAAPVVAEPATGASMESALALELGSGISATVITPTTKTPDALDSTSSLFEDLSCDISTGIDHGSCARGWPAERLSPLRGRILVGLYGTPMGPGLGILGTTSPTHTVTLAREQADAYQELLTDTAVIPFFHMVTTIADPLPGGDGDYNHRVPTATIQLWIDVARAHGLMVVLDIQPAHGSLPVELEYMTPFLKQRGVHLAVDPEFMMPSGIIPGERLGSMDGASVNLVQAWLTERAWESGERKLLIIHQFDDLMFEGKERIESYRLVELIWDADGFGGPPAKIADHLQYAEEPGFEYGGFKLFYDYDVPLMTPAEVLCLQPRPVFVVYQ